MLAGVLVGSIFSMMDYKQSTEKNGFGGYSVVVALIWRAHADLATERWCGSRRGDQPSKINIDFCTFP